jgi:tyrosyl-tRNA synthetase
MCSTACTAGGIVGANLFGSGIGIIDLLADRTSFLASKGEAKRALKENSISLNRVKVGEDRVVNSADLISGRFLLLQRGKKNYFLVKVV